MPPKSTVSVIASRSAASFDASTRARPTGRVSRSLIVPCGNSADTMSEAKTIASSGSSR